MGENQADDQTLEMLMRAAQGGDGRAYTRLLKRITPHLRRMIRHQRQLLPSADIEDLVQDVLLSLHAVRATYDPARPFMPWLVAIAQNRMADSTRRYMRRRVHETSVEQYPVTFVDEETKSDGEQYGDPEALRRAIKTLPSGQREAIEM